MKIETKKTYTFEPGDVIRKKGFYIVAVRIHGYPSDRRWQSTDSGQTYNDAEVERFLEDGVWVYLDSVAETKF